MNNIMIANTAFQNITGFQSNNTGNKFIRNNSLESTTQGFYSSGDINLFLLNTAAKNDYGIWGQGNGQIFSQNSLTYNGSSGLRSEGDKGVVVLNSALGNSARGLEVFGGGIKVVANRADFNLGDGVDVSGGSGVVNVVAQNRADANGGSGIAIVFGSPNIVKANAAFDNVSGFDLYETNPGCSGDVWVANTFQATNQPSCVH